MEEHFLKHTHLEETDISKVIRDCIAVKLIKQDTSKRYVLFGRNLM